MVTSSLAERARAKTAKWVLWGYAFIATFGCVLHVYSRLSHTEPITWTYVVCFVLIGGAAIIALILLPRSLEIAMQAFAWVALTCIAVLVLYEIENGKNYTLVAYMFHVGIFTVGLILGFWPAMRLAIGTSVFLLSIAYGYGEWGIPMTASVLACALALPAKVVETLIRESTQELTRMNEQLRQEIVERKRAQAELKLHQEHLEDLVVQRTQALTQANAELQARNEDLDAFAHTVAHDLKSPLATLIGFSSLLESRHERMEEEQRQYAFNSITTMGRRMTNIIDELLLFSSVRRVEDLALDPVDMASVTKDAVQRLLDMVNEYEADIVLPENWPDVWSYAPWIEEVWTNYISNAIKYGGNPDEGIPPRVELGFSYEIPQSSSSADGDINACIVFWVHDNGKGLTPDEQVRLFTPFTRLEQARARGHGLGLSITKRIVERLGGEVGVESQQNQGSTFYFTLPRYDLHDQNL